jgi:hypothetical protein
VDSSNFKPEQIERLRAVISRQLNNLNRLCGRMQQRHWPVDDPLSRAAITARAAMQDLYTVTGSTSPKS